ncbi:MAG TPA: histidine kinase dimerization/phospho-acceptor domain-containing protein, partial [Ktedonobacteraceae bacterium]|nr:histidine kinase dimerization/phospho-acceptor domain-containing protein [Ktedonobacteraceae bacterium]
MEAQDTQEDGFSQSEVIAALLDLARLSYHFASATSQTPGALATMLLERLLAICEAKRGALVCTTHSPTGVKPAVVVPPSSKTFRTLALYGLSEEKAQALVMTISADDADVQSPPGEPCWLISRLSISGYLHPRQVTLAQQQDHRAEPPIAGQPKPFSLSLYTFLVLGWEGNDERACIAATKKGQTVLPFVTDAAGSALMNILLVEHIAELEALADRKALREMELLKAELLATVSHELRSPLASIKGYAATLLRHERRILREERHEFLLAITQASDRLESVIDRLLEISRLETGSITIERSSVDLAYLVREAIIAVER